MGRESTPTFIHPFPASDQNSVETREAPATRNVRVCWVGLLEAREDSFSSGKMVTLIFLKTLGWTRWSGWCGPRVASHGESQLLSSYLARLITHTVERCCSGSVSVGKELVLLHFYLLESRSVANQCEHGRRITTASCTAADVPIHLGSWSLSPDGSYIGRGSGILGIIPPLLHVDCLSCLNIGLFRNATNKSSTRMG